MTQAIEQRYQERLNRYVTAMHNGKPDQVPIRPFVAEFTASFAGYTCQQVTHDFEFALTAARKCATEFDWDATVGNMIYVWTGLTQAIGLKYYGTPGIDLPPNVGFQYIEPPENQSHMMADEYDRLIENPTKFLLDTWLPRVSNEVVPIGQPVTAQNNLSFLKGGMAMLHYFAALGGQNDRLRNECGTVPAISGILKAPLDILGDKLRGYYGLSQDLLEQPDKVLQACRALMPHLLHTALSGADPDHYLPITIWMHRGCVPLITPKQFDTIFWPTLKPIVEAIWKEGHQVLFYAEGNWDAHLEAFAELADASIIYHVDRGDIFDVHKVLGNKFCLSGGIPNAMLGVGSPQEVRDYCKRVIDGVAADGGYIMDASAIIQNDARVENIRAMTDATREFGVYRNANPPKVLHNTQDFVEAARNTQSSTSMPAEQGPKPGICRSWDEKRKEITSILGEEDIACRVWEDVESFAHTYIWHCLVSF